MYNLFYFKIKEKIHKSINQSIKNTVGKETITITNNSQLL